MDKHNEHHSVEHQEHVAETVQATEPGTNNQIQPQQAATLGVNNELLHDVLIKILIGCLVAAASVAVVAVLVGSITDVVWRAILTVVMAAAHSAILLGLVSSSNSKRQFRSRALGMILNAGMVVTILSFVTLLLLTWNVLSWSLAYKLYMTYAVAFIGLVRGTTLMSWGNYDRTMRPYINAGYGVILTVSILLLGAIYAAEEMQVLLGDFYGRLLAASLIVDVTLTIVTSIVLWMHVQKHPEPYNEVGVARPHYSPAIVLVIIFGASFMFWPYLSMLMLIGR